MAKTSAIRQIPVYTAKNFRLFINQNDWKFIAIAGVISLLICLIVGKDMFTTYESTKMGFFAITSASIWIGVFNSIQRICREHSTITSEYRSGLHIRAYVLSHIIFDAAVCFIQCLIQLVICFIFIDFPEDGVIFVSSAIDYFITLFLITWGADIMGIMISSAAPDPNTAMTAMPFVLILQLVMSGVLFKLRSWSELISNITFSKWGMSALGNIGYLNDPSIPYELSAVYPEVVRIGTESIYDRTVENLLQSWLYMLLISAVFAVIAILSLKLRNRSA